MEAFAGDTPEQPSSFGIKKIVDCKIGEGGQQMYKVKWEATWEPAENLVSCQHLVDEFWSFVNKAKAKEVEAQQSRKRMMLGQNSSILALNQNSLNQNFDRISDADKADLQRLIACASSTSVGNHMVMSPSNMLKTSVQHSELNSTGIAPMHVVNKHFPNSPQVQNSLKNLNTPSIGKVEPDDSKDQSDAKQSFLDGKSSGMASLRYLESFSNPYVKVIIVCKICNKEQSLKFAGNWRQHYMTHSEKKPHTCPHCSKAFIRGDRLRQHIQSKHNIPQHAIAPNGEQMTLQENVKFEDYSY